MNRGVPTLPVPLGLFALPRPEPLRAGVGAASWGPPTPRLYQPWMAPKDPGWAVVAGGSVSTSGPPPLHTRDLRPVTHHAWDVVSDGNRDRQVPAPLSRPPHTPSSAQPPESQDGVPITLSLLVAELREQSGRSRDSSPLWSPTEVPGTGWVSVGLRFTCSKQHDLGGPQLHPQGQSPGVC